MARNCGMVRGDPRAAGQPHLLWILIALSELKIVQFQRALGWPQGNHTVCGFSLLKVSCNGNAGKLCFKDVLGKSLGFCGHQMSQCGWVFSDSSMKSKVFQTNLRVHVSVGSYTRLQCRFSLPPPLMRLGIFPLSMLKCSAGLHTLCGFSLLRLHFWSNLMPSYIHSFCLLKCFGQICRCSMVWCSNLRAAGQPHSVWILIAPSVFLEQFEARLFSGSYLLTICLRTTYAAEQVSSHSLRNNTMFRSTGHNA